MVCSGMTMIDIELLWTHCAKETLLLLATGDASTIAYIGQAITIIDAKPIEWTATVNRLRYIPCQSTLSH